MRNTVTIYIPRRFQDARLGERLRKLAEQKDRSVNYLAVAAILDYVEREENLLKQTSKAAN